VKGSSTRAGKALPDGAKPRNKFGAVKAITRDGVLCDSKKEAARWEMLKSFQAAGLLSDLMPHPSFPLYVNGTRAGRITGDALYVRAGRLVWEDTKSRITAGGEAYRQRLSLFRACYPHILIEEWL
jgi:hypothetical protein